MGQHIAPKFQQCKNIKVCFLFLPHCITVKGAIQVVVSSNSQQKSQSQADTDAPFGTVAGYMVVTNSFILDKRYGWGITPHCSEITPDCTQGSFLAVLQGSYTVSGIKLGLAVCKANSSHARPFIALTFHISFVQDFLEWSHEVQFSHEPGKRSVWKYWEKALRTPLGVESIQMNERYSFTQKRPWMGARLGKTQEASSHLASVFHLRHPIWFPMFLCPAVSLPECNPKSTARCDSKAKTNHQKRS